MLFIGPPGIGKSHICLSLALAAIQAGHTVLFRSAFDLAEDLSEAAVLGARKELIQKLTRTSLLVIEDLGMRKLPATAAEDLLDRFPRHAEIVPLTGKSYRMHDRQQQRRSPRDLTDTTS